MKVSLLFFSLFLGAIARADNVFSFDGGSGAPFVITVSKPIHIRFTNAVSNLESIGLVLKNVYPSSLGAYHFYPIDGLSLTGPGFGVMDITHMNIVIPAGDWGSNGREISLGFRCPSPQSFSAGDTLLISPGTATTAGGVPEPVPNPIGPYTFVVMNNFAYSIAATASVVGDPTPTPTPGPPPTPLPNRPPPRTRRPAPPRIDGTTSPRGCTSTVTPAGRHLSPLPSSAAARPTTGGSAVWNPPSKAPRPSAAGAPALTGINFLICGLERTSFAFEPPMLRATVPAQSASLSSANDQVAPTAHRPVSTVTG